LKETFAFDPAGNLLDPDASGNPVQIDTRKVLRELDAQPTNIAAIPPKLAKVTHNLLRQYMGYVYEYDVQGNTISKRLRVAASANDEGVLEFSYDTENRLTTATRTFANSRQIARYSYDAFGRRIAKQLTSQHWEAAQPVPQVDVALTDSITIFVWDGDRLVQEVNADRTVTYLYEPDSFVPLASVESGEGAATYMPSGTHLRHIRNWELHGIKDDLDEHVKARQCHLEAARASCQQNDWERRQHLACNDASKDIILYYQCDHLGTPLQLLDENGKIYWSARYRVWGEILQYYATDVLQPLRFQGQYYDQETGLYYTRHRYFDPVTGRFVSQDPIGLLGGENQYQYGPNPTGWIDPLGLQRKNKKSAPERKEGNPNSAETSPCKNFVRVRHYTGVLFSQGNTTAYILNLHQVSR
jgi:RHS repeat-associated protein